MRVALVVHDCDPGVGHGRYTWEIARRLSRDNQVHVFANRFAPGLPEAVQMHVVRAWRRWAVGSVITFLVSCERAIRAGQFDLVHAQGLTCWSADVITAHICNSARYGRQPPVGLGKRVFPWLVLPLERRFYHQRRARHLIAISKCVASEVQEHYGWDRPTSIIYHGTDVEHFHPPTAVERTNARLRYTLDTEARVWLFIGEAVKGLRETLEQLVAFPDAMLLVVSRSDFAPYRQLAERLGVLARVRFWGPEESPLFAYHAADALVYPSGYDAFGMVVAEAMACGLPVIAGCNIGAAEWIEDKRNGLLCEPDRPGHLEAQLRWLAADPGRAAEVGRSARSTAGNHTWDRCAQQTAEVYASVGPPSGGPRAPDRPKPELQTERGSRSQGAIGNRGGSS